MPGVTVLLIAVVVGTFAIVALKVVDGRFRNTDTASDAAPRLSAEQLGASALGERATLVQFSSAFCAPCRATRVVLSSVVEPDNSIAHIEIDAESHLDLVRELNIVRTPTVLILDSDGRIVQRASGAPRRDQVLTVLQSLGISPSG